ncbi:MAG TPA: hypothetical protein VLT13_06705 [Bacteroidota bacterium]|nr:hypothetical protein [Bacteroidota bacterium]
MTIHALPLVVNGIMPDDDCCKVFPKCAVAVQTEPWHFPGKDELCVVAVRAVTRETIVGNGFVDVFCPGKGFLEIGMTLEAQAGSCLDKQPPLVARVGGMTDNTISFGNWMVHILLCERLPLVTGVAHPRDCGTPQQEFLLPLMRVVTRCALALSHGGMDDHLLSHRFMTLQTERLRFAHRTELVCLSF